MAKTPSDREDCASFIPPASFVDQLNVIFCADGAGAAEDTNDGGMLVGLSLEVSFNLMPYYCTLRGRSSMQWYLHMHHEQVPTPG